MKTLSLAAIVLSLALAVPASAADAGHDPRVAAKAFLREMKQKQWEFDERQRLESQKFENETRKAMHEIDMQADEAIDGTEDRELKKAAREKRRAAEHDLREKTKAHRKSMQEQRKQFRDQQKAAREAFRSSQKR